jgi:tripartite-type tricarboxylate transporter receptor subunit TctC
MMKSIKALVVALVAFSCAIAGAQTYPTKTVTMLIPFAAGGPTDVIGRVLAQSMSKTLGQTVIVENVTGAGGTIATRRLKRSEPDGYTFLVHHLGYTTAPSLYRPAPYDAVNDFEMLGLITDVPMTLVSSPKFPAKDFKELVAYLKENKQKVNLANAGPGAVSHLCGMLFQSAIGVELTTIPYKGTGPALNDLMGGQVDLLCDQITNTGSPIKAGKIKVYGSTTKTRLPGFPDIPTLHEAGLPNFEVVIWHGAYAPKGTPKPILDKLNGALKASLKDPYVIERFAMINTVPVEEARVSRDVHKKFVADEVAKWSKVISAAGVYAE